MATTENPYLPTNAGTVSMALPVKPPSALESSIKSPIQNPIGAQTVNAPSSFTPTVTPVSTTPTTTPATVPAIQPVLPNMLNPATTYDAASVAKSSQSAGADAAAASKQKAAAGGYKPTIDTSASAQQASEQAAAAAKQKAAWEKANKPLDVKIDPTNPKAMEDVGLQVKQAQAQQAKDQLVMQQAAMRQQTQQQLFEAGIKGSGLSALMALNSRDASSQLADLDFKIASDLGQYLASKADTKSAAAQANHVTTFTSLLTVNPEEATKFASEMAARYPDETYWQDLQNPGIMQALIKANEPGATKVRNEAIDTAKNEIALKGYDLADPSGRLQYTAEFATKLKDIYSPEYINTAMVSWEKTPDAKEALAEYAFEKGLSPEQLTEDMKQEAWLQGQADLYTKNQYQADVKAQISEGFLDVGDMSDEERTTIAKNLSKLAASGGFIDVYGNILEAANWDGTAGEIFIKSWTGTDFKDMSAKEMAANRNLDSLWMDAVTEAGGDLSVSRPEFYTALNDWASVQGKTLDKLNEADLNAFKKDPAYSEMKYPANANTPGGVGYLKSWADKSSALTSTSSITDPAMRELKNHMNAVGEDPAKWVEIEKTVLDWADNAGIKMLTTQPRSGTIRTTEHTFADDSYAYIQDWGTKDPEGWYLQDVGGTIQPVYLSWQENTNIGSNTVFTYTLSPLTGSPQSGQSVPARYTI